MTDYRKRLEAISKGASDTHVYSGPPLHRLKCLRADLSALLSEGERMREAAREAGWALGELVDTIAWEKRTQVQGIIERLGQALGDPDQ